MLNQFLDFLNDRINNDKSNDDHTIHKISSPHANDCIKIKTKIMMKTLPVIFPLRSTAIEAFIFG